MLPHQPQQMKSLPITMNAEDSRHFLRMFIQTYRDLPVLWDTSLRDYTNRDKRAEAYEQLVPIYRYLKRDATVEDVKKKINTLRTNYRKELKVVECARRSGTIHQPRCWTFHELDFLHNTEKFLAVNPHARNESTTMGFNENTQTQHSFLDATSGYNFKSMFSNAAQLPHQTPPPSISEMFHKSFGHQPQKMEPQQTPPPQPPPPASSVTPAPTGCGEPNATQPMPNKRQRISSTHNPDDLLNIACDYLSGTFPEEESIARTWTHKLKRMQREQRLLAEKFINEILFEGESATLHRGSVQINSNAFEPYVRFEEQQQQTPHHTQDESSKSQQSPSVHTSTSLTIENESKGINVATGGGGGVVEGSANEHEGFNSFT